jgi:putative ABC transport system permease protein
MIRLSALLSRLLATFRKQRLEDELDDELRFHLQMETEENIRRGMSAQEAHYAARRSFGGFQQTREIWRDRRYLPWLESWLRDLRFAVRSLARAPLFTLFAVASLALGIGANTALFTALHALVLRPLPYPQPERLVKLWETSMWHGQAGWSAVSVPNLRDWREQNTAFDRIAGFTPGGFNLAGRGETDRVSAARVESDLFPLLGVAPALGRAILPEENIEGRDRVAVLSDGLWRRRFGADHGIIGRTIAIDGAAHTVIGVMPPGFQFPPRSDVQIWVPLTFARYTREARGSHWLEVVARLRPGVAPEMAQRNMDAIARRIYPEDPTHGVGVLPLHSETVRATAQVLLVLFGAVGFVLLLACANVAHLVLARMGAQKRELAVRAALGAGRWRIVRLLLVEVLLLGAAGGIAGLVLAWQSLRVLVALAGDQLPQGVPIQMDATVLWFCLAVALLSALLAGLVPALRNSRIDLQSAMKDATGSSGGGLHRSFSPLMICESALSLVLVVGALLMVRSLRNMEHFDFGFQPDRLLTMKVALPGTRTARQSTAFYERAVEKLYAIPGVTGAAVINLVPVQSSHTGSVFTIEGRQTPLPGNEPGAEIRAISSDYFRTMGIPLIAGRFFRPDEIPDPWSVAIVNRSAARHYFPDEDPLGKRIALGIGDGREGWRTIVGIAGNVAEEGAQSPAPPVVYAPLGHPVWTAAGMSLVLRTPRDPASLAGAVRRSIRELEPGAALYLVSTMKDVVANSAADTRLLSDLLTLFSALALVLAMVGVYGVMSHQVSRCTHEIGVRMALGAERGQVLGMVCRRGLWNAMIGAALGLVWTVLTSGIIQHYVIGMSATNLATRLIAVTAILVLALAASFVPAWRASHIEPAVALRNE